MRKSFLPKISLAAKCRLLFGVAVLSILAATLYLPWVRMDLLSKDAAVRLALRAALAARLTANIDAQTDWQASEALLAREWTATAKALKLPSVVPTLYAVDRQEDIRRFAPRGFILESFRRLQQDPTLEYTHKFQGDSSNPSLRFALAVRSNETDPQPNKLRGIIHVTLPVPNEDRHWSLIVLLASGLSGGFLAVLVFYLVTQYLILSPVRELRGVAEQVTGGDIDVRADIATGDEFEELAEAFNDMLAHLKASHDELRTINLSLDVKLEELAETNVSLYESNKLKSEFIANVSHELRTPLGLIINFAELLRDALEDPPEDKTRVMRYTQNILRNGRSLLEIINDLLDLAKIEAGKVELHVTDFSLIDTCNSLIDFVRPIADKKGIRLSNPLSQDLPAIRSDSGKIKQILYNLLSNAIKFTPNGGQVTVTTATVNAGAVAITVADTGPGIEEEMFTVIFEKFRQIDSSLTREHGGTGLGLAITKELANMLGGTITVESKIGQGSTFTVTLPTTAPKKTTKKLIPLND